MWGMDIASKLQIKPGQSVALVSAPGPLDLGLPEGCETTDDPEGADVVLAFAGRRADLDGAASAAVAAARRDKTAWIGYPKGGGLGTDLNRDILAKELRDRGVRPVRQISIDDVWSALRFRPA